MEYQNQNRLRVLGSKYQFIVIVLLGVILCIGFTIRIVNNTNLLFTFTAFDDPSNPGFLYNGRTTFIYWSTQLTTVLTFLTICVCIYFLSLPDGKYTAISNTQPVYQNMYKPSGGNNMTTNNNNNNDKMSFMDKEKSKIRALKISRIILLTIIFVSLSMEIIYLVANSIEISKCNTEPYNICNDIRWCCVYSEPNMIMSGCPIYTNPCEPAISPSNSNELNWNTTFLISFVINIIMIVDLIILFCIILFINSTIRVDDNNNTSILDYND